MAGEARGMRISTITKLGGAGGFSSVNRKKKTKKGVCKKSFQARRSAGTVMLEKKVPVEV